MKRLGTVCASLALALALTLASCDRAPTVAAPATTDSACLFTRVWATAGRIKPNLVGGNSMNADIHNDNGVACSAKVRLVWKTDVGLTTAFDVQVDAIPSGGLETVMQVLPSDLLTAGGDFDVEIVEVTK